MSPENNTTSSLQEKLKTTSKDPVELTAVSPEDESLNESYETLKNQLIEQEKKISHYREQSLRAQAESENILQRTKKEIEKAHKYALEKFILELLPIIDNLERALQVSPTQEEADQGMLHGIQLTLKMFRATLEKFEVEEINPLQQSFNPEWHQAVSVQAASEASAGIVLEVLQKGYLLNKRLVRPALVIVAQ